MRALVTDVHVRSPLAGMRGLGRAGVPVVAVADRPAGAGLWSRYAHARVVGPTARDEPEGFARTVAGAARRYGPAVVFPGTERALEALLAHPALLPETAVLACPGDDVLDRLRDKASLTERARAAGLRAPVTRVVESADELRAMRLGQPVVVKPQRPSPVFDGAQLVRGVAELQALAHGLGETGPLLVQEALPGPLMAVAVVVDRDGRVVERFQQQTLRTFPADAGVSAVAVSIAPDEELVARVAELLRSAGFWGLAQLQFLAGGGTPALIDVNPRFFGSLPLALAAGVNLPAAWYAVALGRATGGPRNYRPGVRFRWLQADLVLAARHGRGLGAVRRRMRPLPRPVAGALWAADDPVSSAVITGEEVGARLRRRLPSPRR